jgi:hypothetical protein
VLQVPLVPHNSVGRSRYFPRWASHNSIVGILFEGFITTNSEVCLSLSLAAPRRHICLPKIMKIETLHRKSSLSRHLRDARIKRRLSVAEVAEQADVSQSAYSSRRRIIVGHVIANSDRCFLSQEFINDSDLGAQQTLPSLKAYGRAA